MKAASLPVGRRLGKQVPKIDKRTLRLADFLRVPAVAPLPCPPERDWGSALHGQWPMLGNDRMGCCTVTALAHLLICQARNDGRELVIDEEQVSDVYAEATGYDPVTGVHDNGAAMLDILKYAQQVGIGGVKIGPYLALESRNHAHLMTACNLFGGVYLGLALPATAQAEVGDTWLYPEASAGVSGEPWSWGGHAVGSFGYSPQKLTCITWAVEQALSWPFLDRYCDEAYAVLSAEWTGPDGKAPSGLDVAALEAALERVRS